MPVICTKMHFLDHMHAQTQRPVAGKAAVERFAGFFDRCKATPLAPQIEALREATMTRLRPESHGDLSNWLAVLEQLPRIQKKHAHLDAHCVMVESAQRIDSATNDTLRRLLASLHPWRKGPFCLHGIYIDSEWRCDWKWARLIHAIAPLRDRLVMDVGCGNGYYGYRALAADAKLVLGIDPTLRFVLQFLAINQFIQDDRLTVLPLADDDLPAQLGGFDTVFSMGVLYHRRDPIAHLARMRRLLRPGGELVLETLVLDESGRNVLIPAKRYAKMRNVYAIPSTDAVIEWLGAANLQQVRLVNLTPTTTAEQRTTPWMHYQSLSDFLHPSDSTRTLEGYPAPVRAILLAQR